MCFELLGKLMSGIYTGQRKDCHDPFQAVSTCVCVFMVVCLLWLCVFAVFFACLFLPKCLAKLYKLSDFFLLRKMSVVEVSSMWFYLFKFIVCSLLLCSFGSSTSLAAHMALPSFPCCIFSFVSYFSPTLYRYKLQLICLILQTYFYN